MGLSHRAPHKSPLDLGCPAQPSPGCWQGPAPWVAGWGGKMLGAPAATQFPVVAFEALPYRPFFVKALASPP